MAVKKYKNIFYHLNQITQYKNKNYWNSLNENEKKEFNIFMINRYLSMNYYWVDIINFLQKYNHSLPKNLSYILYEKIIPKEKIFLRYIKNKNNKSIDKQIINILKKYFECSKSEVLDYLNILNKDDIKKILFYYGEEIKL